MCWRVAFVRSGLLWNVSESTSGGVSSGEDVGSWVELGENISCRNIGDKAQIWNWNSARWAGWERRSLILKRALNDSLTWMTDLLTNWANDQSTNQAICLGEIDCLPVFGMSVLYLYAMPLDNESFTQWASEWHLWFPPMHFLWTLVLFLFDRTQTLRANTVWLLGIVTDSAVDHDREDQTVKYGLE